MRARQDPFAYFACSEPPSGFDTQRDTFLGPYRGWDGEWFLRAYNDSGRKIGSHECDEGRIFVEPQGFCIMAGIGLETGRVEIRPPTALESQQLRLHTGQDVLDMEFTEAALMFSDGTFEEISRQAQWKPPSDNRPAQIYASRQREREEMGAELLPR